MSIFISIASYQDPLLESTVFSAIHNADNPNDLVFGICDQSSNIKDLLFDLGKCSFSERNFLDTSHDFYLFVVLCCYQW